MKSKYLLRKSTIVFILSCIISCNKDDMKKPDLPKHTFTINYRGQTTDVKEFHLILSSGNNKILDTLMSTSTDHIVDFKSESDRIDLSLISVNDAVNNTLQPITVHNIITFLAVTPGNWSVTLDCDEYLYTSEPYVTQAIQPATIHYTNVPVVPDDFQGYIWFSNRDKSNGSNKTMVYTPNQMTLDINYQKGPSDFLYLLAESKGKYFFLENPDLNATVDFANASDAIKIKYPELDYKSVYAALYGYTESVAPFSSGTWIYANYYNSNRRNSEYDLIYPGSAFKKYKSWVTWSDPSSNSYGQYYFGSTALTSIQPWDASYINIKKNTTQELVLEFPKEQPTFYKEALATSSSNVIWRIYGPPTVTSIKPEIIYEHLKRAIDPNVNFTDLQVKSVVIGKADNLSYQDFWSIIFDKNVLTNRGITSSKKFTKKLN